MRHGQASFGGADYDRLSSVGEAQARHAARALAAADRVPDRIVSGPRVRQKTTALCARDALGGGQAPAIEEEPRLDEFTAGLPLMQRVLEDAGSRPREELIERYLAALEAWGRGDLEVQGAESMHAFLARVTSWLDDLSRSRRRGERVLAVTSAGVVAAAATLTLGLPAPTWGRLVRVVRNGSLTEIAYTSDRRTLLSFNGAAHLPRELETWI